jgi:ComF family protein
MKVPGIQWLYELLYLFYPRQCMACGHALFQQEEVICLKCLLKLPQTQFHLHEENPVSRVFWGRVDVQHAASFLFFSKKGMVQQLIHQLKYKSQKEVGVFLGQMYAKQLIQDGCFADIDLILPVPLHPKKQFKRGFNQSEQIALGMSQFMHIPCDKLSLIRSLSTSTQTHKSRYERWKNVSSSFEVVHPEKLEGKHLLLVDDVITTGATLEACAHKLLAVYGTKVSVVSLAYALV